ncbi:DDE superfamily endonuclease [Popillia japonica]|uniref:DDE superfamily endonuclease n=1 Tax=Popillia japonica TaxID=7064 RepID=A0AAW1JFN4_POPJA
MDPGDLILADKGFLISDIMPKGVYLNIPPFLSTPQFTEAQVYETRQIAKAQPKGVYLNIPPFLSTPQFTEAQVYETRQIAKARIHVERAIRRVKCYSILDRIPQYLIPQLSKIFQLCAALTNFQYPLIKEVEA